MIALKYQVFFFDQRVNRERQLICIKPAFDLPAAHENLLRTAKYEGLLSLICIGSQEQVDKLCKMVERLDLTDWMDFSIEERVAALKSLCQMEGIRCEERLRNWDEQFVAGDDVEEEVTAASRDYPYPIDLPESNKDRWDSVAYAQDFRETMAKFKAAGAKLDKLSRLSVYTNFYEEYCRLDGVAAFINVTPRYINDRNQQLGHQLARNRRDAVKFLGYCEDHLLDAGLIKKAKAEKFVEVRKEASAHPFVVVFEIPWLLDPADHSWRTVKSFILREVGKKYGLAHDGNNLKHKVSSLCEVVLCSDENQIRCEIRYLLTELDAAMLTGQKDSVRVFKKITELARRWKKPDKPFPTIT